MIVVCELQNGGSFLLGCDNDIILDCKNGMLDVIFGKLDYWCLDNACKVGVLVEWD